MDGLRLRCGEGVDAWSCLGEPCLRRKYRGAAGLESGSTARVRRVGEDDGDEDARALLKLLSSSSSSRGCGGLEATSVGRGEFRASTVVPPAPKSEWGAWENEGENPSCEYVIVESWTNAEGWEPLSSLSVSSWETGMSLVMVGHVREPFGVTRGVSVDDSDSCEPPTTVGFLKGGKGKGRETGENVEVLLTGVGVPSVSVWCRLVCAACEPEGIRERSEYPTSRYGHCCDSRSGTMMGSVDLRSSGLDWLEWLTFSCWSTSSEEGPAALL
jgi:hypothetical protein